MYFHIPNYNDIPIFVIQRFVFRMAKYIKKHKNALFFKQK